jgi:hypothetical protein
MGTIVYNGQSVIVDFDTITFQDNPKCKLGSRSFRKRNAQEQKNICAIVCHTTKGIPGGKDLTPQTINSGSGTSSNAGPRMSATWQADKSKFGGAHFVIDYDGMVYQCADIYTDATYHAESANGNSIGIEDCQNSDASLYEIQIQINTKLIFELTKILGIQRQICKLPYNHKPVKCLERKLNRYGVFGHRNLTSNRGSGDPGDFILQALADAGCEQFDYDLEEDLQTWKERQQSLGIADDGVPGSNTVDALKSAGYSNGIWVPDFTP